jgi:hypothetical protein
MEQRAETLKSFATSCCIALALLDRYDPSRHPSLEHFLHDMFPDIEPEYAADVIQRIDMMKVFKSLNPCYRCRTDNITELNIIFIYNWILEKKFFNDNNFRTYIQQCSNSPDFDEYVGKFGFPWNSFMLAHTIVQKANHSKANHSKVNHSISNHFKANHSMSNHFKDNHSMGNHFKANPFKTCSMKFSASTRVSNRLRFKLLSSKVKLSILPVSNVKTFNLISKRQTTNVTLFNLISKRQTTNVTLFNLISKRQTTNVTPFNLISKRQTTNVTLFNLNMQLHFKRLNLNLPTLPTIKSRH